MCVCVLMHLCDRVHAPMCRPVPVFAECRQTDEEKTERHISFIGLLGVLLFCFGGLVGSCPHCFTMTSHALQYVSLNESFSSIFRPKVLMFLKRGGEIPASRVFCFDLK